MIRGLNESQRPRTRRRGLTLIEVVVAMSILAIGSTIGILALRQPHDQPDLVSAAVVSARRRAIQSGQPIVSVIRVNDTMRVLAARPDGSIVADPALGVDPLTGLRRAGR